MTAKKSIPSAWTKSDKNIRAVQVIFELAQEQFKAVRLEAIKQNLSPSDYIRDIVGLPRKKPLRPRLSISLSTEDYEILARRYQLTTDMKEKIREKIKEELVSATKNESPT